jgi:hypothetical protein
VIVSCVATVSSPSRGSFHTNYCTCMDNNRFFVGMVLSHSSVARVQWVSVFCARDDQMWPPRVYERVYICIYIYIHIQMYNNIFFVDMVLSHSSVACVQLVSGVWAKHLLKADGICLMLYVQRPGLRWWRCPTLFWNICQASAPNITWKQMKSCRILALQLFG